MNPTMLAGRANSLAQSKTSAMRSIANRLAEQGVTIINFAAGEIGDDTATEIKNGAKDAIDRATNGYTDTAGLNDLRSGIAANFFGDAHRVISADNVMVTGGAKPALFNAALLLFQEGNEVLIPSPYWTTFATQIELVGAKAVGIDSRRPDFGLDVAAIAEAISPKTRGIIVNSPCNPTGSVISEHDLDSLIKLIKPLNIYLIFDECYSTFLYDGRRHIRPFDLDPGIFDRTVVINSFSKSHALAGWRLGYMMASETIIKKATALQSHTNSNPNSIAQHAMLRALESSHISYPRELHARLTKNRSIGVTSLHGIQHVSAITPQGGFYFYLQLGKLKGRKLFGTTVSDADQVASLLLEHAYVSTVPGSAFADPWGLRVSFSLSESQVADGMNRLRDAFVGNVR
ncbi:pyridoxal phosphate-dependent aminotransferase [Bradyrhizobium jicamae]|uniref:pyridoxal phosphate-dependent aminotransferase n=1 Tax=Bradyrhizobium jicamae TaxID=280332 RepID=UPI001BAC3C0F|nr:aminotransferase class I/II-fold pyridoxal phosphate-dependent enzyme [Bradyrhizobium jicamae]MBR0936507.1 aminotransferase class I/II-fold pyridoxal phosphate-dependent enzyme [Bradyrhizobium jicamae]